MRVNKEQRSVQVSAVTAVTIHSQMSLSRSLTTPTPDSEPMIELIVYIV